MGEEERKWIRIGTRVEATAPHACQSPSTDPANVTNPEERRHKCGSKRHLAPKAEKRTELPLLPRPGSSPEHTPKRTRSSPTCTTSSSAAATESAAAAGFSVTGRGSDASSERDRNTDVTRLGASAASARRPRAARGPRARASKKDRDMYRSSRCVPASRSGVTSSTLRGG